MSENEPAASGASRRRLLAGGAAVAGSTAGAVLLGATPAEAANGSPILAGRANSATAATSLTNTSTSGSAHGLLISTKGGYGFQATSASNHGVAGITAAASKAGVLATHNGPNGTGAALIANGRVNTGAVVSNTGTEKPALLAKATWNESGRSATAIMAVASAPNGVGISAEGTWGVVARSTGGEAAFSGVGIDESVGASIGAVTQNQDITPVALRVHSNIVLPDPPEPTIVPGTAIDAYGHVHVNGTLTKSSGSFRIDHPLDPANKYLYHSFVESPDMKNVYDGEVIANAAGEAVVKLPAYFEALNKDVRYQLTPLAAPAPELHVKALLKDRTFTIAGARSGQTVCWQVTSTRKDAWANAHRVQVEQDKPEKERGSYLYPTGFGQPETKRLGYRQPPDVRQANPDTPR